MSKKWLVSPPPPQEFIDSHPELPALIARLLWNRNLRTQEQIDEFLNPDYSQDIHDPFLFNDMNKAVDIIFKAIQNDKKIVVHGDYDADGVCAAAILIKTLKKLEAKNVSVFIPHREIDGYGLNIKTIEALAKEKVELIITCDCGVSNVEEVALAKKLRMQVIITDHHTVSEKLPKAVAIIHSGIKGEKYPDKGLCGAAVAFKLAQALLKKHAQNHETLPDGQSHESFEKWMLDLVAIATIGDMVPLVGESRTLTRYGLTVLNKSKNIGLKELFHAAGMMDENGQPKRKAINSHAVGFQIVPRLNAAGRMDHANAAFQLLMNDNVEETVVLANQLCQNNSDRQKITEQMVAEARRQIVEDKQEKNSVLFVMGESWPTGILGLVSGKLKDEYYRPTIVMNCRDGVIDASGRSISEFNLIAALQSMPEMFEKFGGHPRACGLTLKSNDSLENFKSALIARANKETEGLELVPQIVVEAQVDLENIDWKFYDLLQKFEPFGQENEEPKYLATGLTIINVDPIGQDGKHLRFLLKHNSNLIRKSIGFGLGDPNRHATNWREILKPGDKIDMVFSVGVNEWNGNRELELSVEDIKLAN